MSSEATSAPSVRPGIAERLSRMIRIPTVSAHVENTGPEPFHAFETLLAELYPSTHAALEREKITDFGLLYRWRGTGTTPASAAEPVVLMAHYDVVPVDESDLWTYPPFDGTIADGRVWGRGTLDDKGELCVVLDAVENLVASGFSPARDVYLSFGGNEESHGAAAKAIAAAFQERGLAPWLVLDEGGAVTDAPLPSIPIQAAMVGVSEKGILTARLEARGAGGHASAPGRHLATTRIAHAIRRINRHPFPARMSASVRAMFGAFAAHTEGRAQLLSRGVAATAPVSAKVLSRLGGEPAAMVRTTVAVTMLDGGTAANVLPSQASATLNVRIATGESVDGTMQRLRRIVNDAEVRVELVEGTEPSPESPTTGPQFDLIRAAVTASYPEAVTIPYVQMSATDSRYFHVFSPATYRFAPLMMNTEQRAAIHGVDEYVSIDSLVRGELFYRELIGAIPPA
ncbi:M20/M25/M40 family metallo-hydrolase [Rathayibacter sp. YIM 133350]|uniref:M20/M25/M40 family metallo-hydrolase n=1 Tax=Rathayibacter sp. YIM 133350 TaxID=3131992 RepID=UPI00307E589C